MMRRLAIIVVVIAASGSARAEPPVACFAPDALKATAAEKFVKRRDHSFDQPGAERVLPSAQPIAAALRGSIRRVELPAGEKLIALTFDLCEQRGEVAGYDGAIVDFLRKEGVKATFFAGGKWMRSHGERAAQLIADPLFEVANHSETHPNLRLLDAKAMQDEIAGPERDYEAALDGLKAKQCLPADGAGITPRPALFRFPFGACNQAALDAVNNAGLLAIQWDVSTGDPSPGQSAQAIARAMVKETKPGSIVVSHANGRGWHTAEALPIAIPKLKALGYEFVTVSELLARGKPVVAAACYNVRPGDVDRYDRLFARPPAPKAAAPPVVAKAPAPAKPAVPSAGARKPSSGKS